MTLDIDAIRKDFPILGRTVYGRPLVYLDNGATTQKPCAVIDAIGEEYREMNANVHRGVHYLSQQATERHEAARRKVRDFLHAHSEREIVFTRGTTESLNLVAQSFGEAFMKEGDEVIISEMEHHSNIVPWLMLKERKGINLKVIPITDEGELDWKEYLRLFSPRTRLVSVAHVSNVLGTVNPIASMVAEAHKRGIPFMVDAAQSVPHMSVNVQETDCDFLAFSGHKVYGPTGIGVLYGKEEWLEKLPPWQGGGEMIDHVSFERVTFEKAPLKFEAGTPNYVGSHALGLALEYMQTLGLENILDYEQGLTEYARERMNRIEGMHILGNAAERDAVISFLVGDIHHLDLGTLLDRLGFAVRTGHHCAEPLMHRLGVEGTVRASFSFYNTHEEIDAFCEAIQRIKKMF